MRPDRVVCGVESAAAREAMVGCYRPLNTIEVPILFTSLETSELIKYATNSFLATKITFINEMADLCERVGADVNEVARGMIAPLPHGQDNEPAFRVRPHNLEAEQAVLGGILVDNEAFHRAAEFLTAEHFYEPVHGRGG